MKWKLFGCGVMLVAAGCASNTPPYNTMQECGYTFDPSPRPLPYQEDAQLCLDYDVPYQVHTGAELTMHPAPYHINLTDNP